MQSRKFAFRLKIKSGKTTLRTYLMSLEEKRIEREEDPRNSNMLI